MEEAAGTPVGAAYVLTGADVNPQETDGMFTALTRLADGLVRNDLGQVERAVAMLDRRNVALSFSRAELGARQEALDVLERRLDDEDVELRTSLSDDYDADMAETISDLTGRQYAYEAALQAMANISKLSLLNYL
jgi:flagellin-like hook-associated protein FlgL